VYARSRKRSEGRNQDSQVLARPEAHKGGGGIGCLTDRKNLRKEEGTLTEKEVASERHENALGFRMRAEQVSHIPFEDVFNGGGAVHESCTRRSRQRRRVRVAVTLTQTRERIEERFPDETEKRLE